MPEQGPSVNAIGKLGTFLERHLGGRRGQDQAAGLSVSDCLNKLADEVERVERRRNPNSRVFLATLSSLADRGFLDDPETLSLLEETARLPAFQTLARRPEVSGQFLLDTANVLDRGETAGDQVKARLKLAKMLGLFEDEAVGKDLRELERSIQEQRASEELGQAEAAVQSTGIPLTSVSPEAGSEEQVADEEKARIIPSVEIEIRSIASADHPDRNEDAVFKLPEKRSAGVFDGVGGLTAGDKASRIARDQVSKSLSAIQEGLSLQQAEAAIREALNDANVAVYQQTGSDMGTTASLVYVWQGPGGERKAIIGNVGDSRIYLLRGNRLEQITLDDNRVRSAMPDEQQARRLQSKLSNVIDPQTQLTKSEQTLFNHRNEISQALGQQSVEPRINTVDLRAGDRLIVCSDGISDNLTDNEMSAILNANKNNAEVTQQLIDASQVRSRSAHARAKPDDMTVAIIEEIYQEMLK